MPYVSDRQRRFFHTDTARKKGISAATVKEFDQASKGKKLPEHSGEIGLIGQQLMNRKKKK